MPVTDEAIEKIKGMIVAGELRPGDRLPNEPELAQRLGLSRSSLREAVRALSLLRVLDVRQGDGTYVTSLEPDLLLDAMTFVVDFHRDDTLRHFLQVRGILEPAATAMAASSMTAEQLDELRSVLDAAREAPTVEALVRNDLEFHRRIALGSGNPVLCSLLEGLSGPLNRVRVWHGISREGAIRRTHEQHAMILDALVNRQPELARSWATVHVAGVERWVRDTFGEPGTAR